ncbi:polyketide synthase dehydratase domain-containing protein [Streptomyces sp. M10(2022)]
MVAVDAFYPRVAAAGYEYGPLFQGLRAAWRVGEVVYAEVVLPEGAGGEGFGVHPALFDAVLHGGLVGRIRLMVWIFRSLGRVCGWGVVSGRG